MTFTEKVSYTYTLKTRGVDGSEVEQKITDTYLPLRAAQELADESGGPCVIYYGSASRYYVYPS